MSIYCMYTKADGCVLNTEGIRASSLWLTCGHSHQLFLSSKDYAQQARMCMVPLYNKLFSAIVTVPFSRMTTLFSYMSPPLRCDLTLTHTLAPQCSTLPSLHSYIISMRSFSVVVTSYTVLLQWRLTHTAKKTYMQRIILNPP